MPDTGGLAPRNTAGQPGAVQQTTAAPASSTTAAAPQAWNGYIDQDTLNTIIKGLSTSQVTNPNSQLVNALAASLGKLPLSQSEAVEKDPNFTGTLATDVGQKMQPQSAPSSPYGFDPLSYSQFFQSTLAPYLNSVNQQAQGEIGGYQGQMAQALAGASPQLKAAYAETEPGMQEAETLENQSLQGLAQSSPMFDALVSNLTTATTAAKAAQTAAAEEPYVAAAQGLSSPGTGAGNSQTAANQAAYYQAALAALANGTSNSPAISNALTVTSPTTAAQQASTQNLLGAYNQANIVSGLGS